ncbi:transmembrane protein 14A-like [Eurytemora carolleeae]|uniref:transmembrane protein 14A-like n=1 Tax=Eurytemora carolleeae TaxID=1294199 RepID=UPI000C767249|nr:transmembrane protein 14A-like [Eurytemora carolleeae]|eukprot:XP_023337683.1 transmembrane protein 14A-like [Eurytemora affinis]
MNFQMSVDYIGYVYALTIAVGGMIGFLTKGSLTSCFMGLGVGCISGFAAYRSSQEEKNWGLSLLVSVCLTALMGYRFISSWKFMPSGLVAGFSLIMVLRYGYRALNQEKKKDK